MTILDIILIFFLLGGALLGFKKGAIRSLVALLGTLVIVVLAYYIKNPVADILFKFCPFFKFGGSWGGLVTLNILIYEAIAYLLVFTLLYSILNILLKVSGIIEKILTFTIILGIPSKIIGAILGLLESVVFCFLVLFTMNQFNVTHELVSNSSIALSIINKTPFIGSMIKNTNKATSEIEQLANKYIDSVDKDTCNKEILNILLKYEVVTKDTVKYLIDEKKLDFKGANTVLNNYTGEKND